MPASHPATPGPTRLVLPGLTLGLALALALSLALAACGSGGPHETDPDAERRVRFTYAATITELPPGQTARIWIPLPTSGPHQQVEIVSLDIPGEHRQTTDVDYGNRVLYTEAVARADGTIPLSIEYDITRRGVQPGDGPVAEEIGAFLEPARLVPTGNERFVAILNELSKEGSPSEVARRLFDAVDARMTYDKPAGGGWGRGDAVWACAAGFGNCTDFHSLFLSLARGVDLPARFEMGFPLPSERGAGPVAGYHCWAWFLEGERWVPVDISEADKHPEQRDSYFARLDTDRIGFTIGRDLVLDPPTSRGPVNFLIYPYVEVNGQTHSSMEKQFAYEDT